MIRVALVGSAFRAAAFARVITALPERFEPTAVWSPSAASRDGFARRWGMRAADSPEALGPADLVVAAVPPAAALQVVRRLVDAGQAVLTETPAAPDVPSLVELWSWTRRGARIQVAEQYHLEPLVAAQLAIARGGLLGDVTEATVSIAHDYHGMSVLRRALGVGYEDAEVVARRRETPIVEGPSRTGDPETERTVRAVSTTAWLDLGDRFGVYAFDDQQYRSWIRSPSLVIRGSHGEVRDEVVRRLVDARTPVVSPLVRVAAGGAGSHEGLFLRGIGFEGGWADRNEYLPARLADEEIAVARILERAGRAAAAGEDAYSVAEAAQDQYLALTVRRAAEEGRPVRTQRQPWAPPD